MKFEIKQEYYRPKQVYVRMNNTVFDRLDELSKKHKMKKSTIIRQMIDYALENMDLEQKRGEDEG